MVTLLQSTTAEHESLTCCGDSREVQLLSFWLDRAVLSHGYAHQRKDKQHLQHLGMCNWTGRLEKLGKEVHNETHTGRD
jgi:hypothetical protein